MPIAPRPRNLSSLYLPRKNCVRPRSSCAACHSVSRLCWTSTLLAWVASGTPWHRCLASTRFSGESSALRLRRRKNSPLVETLIGDPFVRSVAPSARLVSLGGRQSLIPAATWASAAGVGRTPRRLTPPARERIVQLIDHFAASSAIGSFPRGPPGRLRSKVQGSKSKATQARRSPLGGAGGATKKAQ